MAVLGSFFAGASMVLQKVGVQKSRKIWLLGLVSLVLGELLTVVAYTNAPAILVSPLGALRVIVTTLLSVKYLKEQISQSTKVCLMVELNLHVYLDRYRPFNTWLNTDCHSRT